MQTTKNAKSWLTAKVGENDLQKKDDLVAKGQIKLRTKVYISLGSNINTPPKQIRKAVKALAKLPLTSLFAAAPWYKSDAIGPGFQPDYINTVVAISTSLSPFRLLRELQLIERRQGRRRNVRWGRRTIDLDILLFGNRRIRKQTLSIPHPAMTGRNFVLCPLSDIAPDLVLPDAIPLQQLLANGGAKGIVRLNGGGSRGSIS